MESVPEEESRRFLQVRRRLFAFISLCIRDYHVSEDILQEVWLSVLRAEQQGKKIVQFEAWCMRVARNRIAEYGRRKNDPRWKNFIDDEMLELLEKTFGGEVGERSSANDSVFALQGCMERLSEKSRKVLLLRYFENVGTDKLARMLGTSRESLYVSLSRLRNWLRNCIRESVKAGESV